MQQAKEWVATAARHQVATPEAKWEGGQEDAMHRRHQKVMTVMKRSTRHDAPDRSRRREASVIEAATTCRKIFNWRGQPYRQAGPTVWNVIPAAESSAHEDRRESERSTERGGLAGPP